MEKAIIKALQGGWNDRPYRTFAGSDDGTTWTHYESFLLDPEFWQALGKTCGLNKTICVFCLNQITYGEDSVSMNTNCNHKDTQDLEKKWLNVWHRMVDHLAEGGNVDEFFTKLI